MCVKSKVTRSSDTQARLPPAKSPGHTVESTTAGDLVGRWLFCVLCEATSASPGQLKLTVTSAATAAPGFLPIKRQNKLQATTVLQAPHYPSMSMTRLVQKP